MMASCLLLLYSSKEGVSSNLTGSIILLFRRYLFARGQEVVVGGEKVWPGVAQGRRSLASGFVPQLRLHV